MGLLALVRAQLALSGAVGAVLLGLLYGLAWLGLAAIGGRGRSGAGLRIGLGAVVLGVLGGLVLVGVSIAARGPAPLLTGHAAPFVAWASVTTLVAVAEEVVLRGVFFDAARQLVGPLGAAVLAALAFALIHVPLDGWSILPLDIGAGLWLAGLRLASGSVAAPAAAHIVADLATWWL